MTQKLTADITIISILTPADQFSDQMADATALVQTFNPSGIFGPEVDGS